MLTEIGFSEFSIYIRLIFKGILMQMFELVKKDLVISLTKIIFETNFVLFIFQENVFF